MNKTKFLLRISDEEDPNPLIQAPFVHKGLAIATNRHIMIAFPTDKPDTVEAMGNAIRPIARWIEENKALPESEFTPLPTDLPESKPCWGCADEEPLFSRAKCPQCGRTGIDPKQTVPVGNTTLAMRYVRLIAKLPNPLIRTDPNDIRGMAYIRFDGGLGVVMPSVIGGATA